MSLIESRMRRSNSRIGPAAAEARTGTLSGCMTSPSAADTYSIQSTPDAVLHQIRSKKTGPRWALKGIGRRRRVRRPALIGCAVLASGRQLRFEHGRSEDDSGFEQHARLA